MMKILMTCVAVISCAITAWGETFKMDRKGDAVVEVRKSDNEYKVTCKFSPHTKFDKAVNAKFNDAKGDSLCKKGLARYLKVATNETLTVSGLYSAAPVETVGERLCYSFGVPVSGCTVAKVEAKPQQLDEPKKPAVDVDTNPKPPVVPDKPESIDPELPKESTNVVARASSFLCVSKYKEVNGERKTISHREYQGRNFKSPKEFERFCQEEFARIRAQCEANLRAVRKMAAKSRL